MDVEMFSFQEILVVYNGISILSLRKDAFSDKAIAMMLLYWVSLEHVCEILEYLLVSNSVDVIVGNFNYDLSKVSRNKILDHLKDYAQVVNEATHISEISNRSCLYKEYIIKRFSVNVKIQNMYFPDHDAVRTVLTNDKVNFSISKSTESYLFLQLLVCCISKFQLS